MKLNFQRIRYKNILAVGNNWIDISFDNGSKNLIIGKNGSGKSTMIEALYFALYGKAFRPSTLGKLVNSINRKHMVCELYFEVANIKYTIKRGIAPNFCELYINGALKDQDSSVKDYQKYIETHILQMNEKTFRQVVVLGSTSYIPFMQLAISKKRIVIEDLLDIGIFGTMSIISKKMIAEAKREYTDIFNKISVLAAKIEVLAKQIAIYNNDNNEMINKYHLAIQTSKNTIAHYDDNILDINNQIKQYTILNSSDLISYNVKLSDLSDKINKATYQREESHKTIKFFENNNNCPSCEQPISDNLSRSKIIDLDNSVELLNIDLSELILRLKEIEEKVAENQKNSNNVNDLVNFKENILTTKNAELDRISVITNHINSLENRATNNSDQELENLTKSSANLKVELNDMKVYGKQLTYLDNILKDTGVKGQIIKTYIPIINQLIRKYLDIMNFSVDFQFDELFNETIKSRGRDEFSYGMFSEGEKLRIDLAILFTWRELAKLKNSASTNLIIFDEIGDSSLDSEGFDMFMSVLENDAADQCCFIISHKPEGIESKVDMIYEFEKSNDFTILKSKERSDIIL